MNYTTTKVKKESPLDTCLQVKLSVDPHTKRKRSAYCVQQFSLFLSKLLDLGCCKGSEGLGMGCSIPQEERGCTAWSACQQGPQRVSNLDVKQLN